MTCDLLFRERDRISRGTHTVVANRLVNGDGAPFTQYGYTRGVVGESASAARIMRAVKAFLVLWKRVVMVQ